MAGDLEAEIDESFKELKETLKEVRERLSSLESDGTDQAVKEATEDLKKDHAAMNVKLEELQSQISPFDDQKYSEFFSHDKKKLYVLVVDDCFLSRKLHKRMLDQLDTVDSEVAEDGQQALSFFCDHSKNFDLILMDMLMPVMDGPTATKELRGKGFDGMIVGVTTGAVSEREKYMESGLDLCIEKPLTISHVKDVLLQIIKRKVQEVKNEAESVILRLNELEKS